MERLRRLQNNKGALNTYYKLKRALEDLEVDAILLEMIDMESDNINVYHAQAQSAAVAAYYEQLGYKRCLKNLFNLANLTEAKLVTPTADYGATERMIASGEMTAEQAKQFSKE